MTEFMNKRRKYVEEYVKAHPKCTQKDIVNYLLNEKKLDSASQATIKRDLEALRFKKVGKKYKRFVKVSKGDDRQLLKDIVSLDEPSIYFSEDNLKVLVVRSNSRKERAMADLITSIFGKKIIGVFVGSNGLMVVAEDREIIKEIGNFIDEANPNNIIDG